MNRNSRFERFVSHRRLDPIQPASEVGFSRSGEGGAGELLGVETERTDERTVLAFGKSSGDGFR